MLPGSVLFLCGMNAIRSPMAELLARRMLPSTVYIASAGVRRGERDPFVDAVLEEEGLISRRPATAHAGRSRGRLFRLIVTLAPEAHHKALEATRSSSVEVEYWPMPDPTTFSGTRTQILDAYRDVRERLKRRLSDRFG